MSKTFLKAIFTAFAAFIFAACSAKDEKNSAQESWIQGTLNATPSLSEQQRQRLATLDTPSFKAYLAVKNDYLSGKKGLNDFKALCDKGNAFACADYAKFGGVLTPKTLLKACEQGASEACDVLIVRYLGHFERKGVTQNDFIKALNVGCGLKDYRACGYLGEYLAMNEASKNQIYKEKKLDIRQIPFDANKGFALLNEACEKGDLPFHSCKALADDTAVFIKAGVLKAEEKGEFLLKVCNKVNFIGQECFDTDMIETQTRSMGKFLAGQNTDKFSAEDIALLEKTCQKGINGVCHTAIDAYKHYYSKDSKTQNAKIKAAAALACERDDGEACEILAALYESEGKNATNLYARACDLGHFSSLKEALLTSKSEEESCQKAALGYGKNADLARFYYDKACQKGVKSACEALK